MASLPPKPQGSPSRDVPNRFQDERDRRSRSHYYRADDRSFPRRWPPGGDSYEPAYEPRRDASDYYRRDIDSRTRRSWDIPPDVDTHFGRGPYDYDYRGYERRGYHVPTPRNRDSYAWRDAPRRRSKTPVRRDRSRSRSPRMHKRVKLGNHSVDASPRRLSLPRPSRFSRSRSRDPSRRPRSRSPRWQSAPYSNPVKTEEGVIQDPAVTQDTAPSQITTIKRNSEASRVLPLRDFPLTKKEEGDGDVRIPREEARPQTDQIMSVAKDESHPPTLPAHPLSPEQKHMVNPPPHLQEPLSDKQTREHEKLDEAKSPVVSSQSRARSPSPARQPRQRGPLLPANPRHRSRSPPKGPRVQPGTQLRGHVTPTGPAASHPPGPRGQRRSFVPQNSLPVPQTQSPVVPSLPTPMEDIKPAIVQTTEVIKVPLPAIPVKKIPESPTEGFDKEITRLQMQRAHLTTDYTNLAEEIRRALHELDTTTIDLRAAELRRKVADAQHEKARNGLLGIDYVPTTETRAST